MPFFSVVPQNEKKKRITAFTFIQVFYLLGFYFVQVCHHLFSPSLDSCQVCGNRFTVSTSAEMKVNSWWEVSDRTGPHRTMMQLLPELKKKAAVHGPMEREQSPRSKSLASVKVDNQWRVFPQFHSAACVSPIGRQRHLKVTLTDHR